MYKHILIPVALDHEHTPNEALTVARKLLDDGGKITAIHVVEPLPGFAAQYLPPQHFETQAQTVRNRMQEAMAGSGGSRDITTQVIEGHAGRAICNYASDHDADLIVVASHRPGLQDYFLGSTAARVVRHAQCAVHVLR